MIVDGVNGVPTYEKEEFSQKRSAYCLLIPVINEGDRIVAELQKAREEKIDELCDIIICDGGSDDGSMESSRLELLGVNTLLIKRDSGHQGAQLRMGIHFAIARGYIGVITIDGNNKDSIECVPLFIEALQEGYGFVQGSRFVKGGKAVNTPLIRHIALRLIHAPVTSLAARTHYTDTTNNFRAYSMEYLLDPRVQPLRDIFSDYELLAFLAIRASQIGYRTKEVPVERRYPPKGKTPTKISFFKGNADLLATLLNAARGRYNPHE